MPLSVDYAWEETKDHVIIRVLLRRVNRKAIDVFLSDSYVKVNCTPYLWEMDLKYTINITASRYIVEEDCTVKLTLVKATPELVWHELKFQGTKAEIAERREQCRKAAEEHYNNLLKARQDQKQVEEKRFFSEHWDLEKQQRADIEAKVKAERSAVGDDLAAWEEEMGVPKPEGHSGGAADGAKGEAADTARPGERQPEEVLKELSPDKVETIKLAFDRHKASKQGGVAAADEKKIFGEADVLPAPRNVETATVEINFTPKSAQYMPSRTRSDDEIYRRSRYKPKNMQDTPLFFKERGDKQYSHKDWKGAADSYSEALKRDTAFLAALTNRACCFMKMHRYERAVEDCDLALNILQSTPAANTTGDRFRHGMMKLYCRRGAANCWNGNYREGLKDYEMAQGYSVGEEHAEAIANDLQVIRETMAAKGLLTKFEASPIALKKSEADRLVTMRKYEEAYDLYTEVLEEEPEYWDAASNRIVCSLHLKRFQQAIMECDKIIARCHTVANSLVMGGVGEHSQFQEDSDDEEDGEVDDEKKNASATVKQNTGRVYSLLKAYIRKGSAYCGLGDWRNAYEHYELALRILPYDNDLRSDTELIRQKLQMNNVIAAATNKPESIL